MSSAGISTSARSGGNRFIFTGGPGAGKTTVLDVLQQRGYTCMPDTARHIIRTRLAAGLSPRPTPVEFAEAIFEIDRENYQLCSDDQTTLFDRSIIDVLGSLIGENATTSSQVEEHLNQYPYHPSVFVFPPWEAIYTTDSERDHTFEHAENVYQKILTWYTRCGYELLEVPPATIIERVQFVEQTLVRLSA